MRGWFTRLLERGEPVEVDPDAIVEAGFVGIVAGQIVVAQLADIGIRVHAVEERLHPSQAATMARIMCRAADVPAARQVIEEVTNL